MPREMTTCPYCQKSVDFLWDHGYVTEPHNILITDSIYHSECWDKQLEEFPPNGGENTENLP